MALIGLALFHKDLLFYRYLIFTTPALCLVRRRRDRRASSTRPSGGAAFVAYALDDRYALDRNLSRVSIPIGCFMHAFPDPDENIETDHHW
ncbi:MAG: hypothetical protein WCA22_07840 [Candidatus Binatus sp.]